MLREGLVDRIFHCAPGSWTLYRCGDCGSGYLDPRPTRETIGLAYQCYFTHAAGGAATTAARASGNLGHALANGYRNRNFGTDYKPAFRLGAWVVPLFPWYRSVIDAESRCLTRAGNGGTVLDVGCGNGGFLALAGALGWCARGIDPDVKAVAAARAQGLDAEKGGIEILDSKSASYDVITLNHVIEHVHDPVELLRACHRLLKSNGRLWLETPNINSQGHALYGNDWRGLEPPRHLILFSLESIRRLLERCGFVEIKMVKSTMLCRHMFIASEAIARRARGAEDARPGAMTRCRSWVAEWRGILNPSRRELITLTARKPT